ncbi:MAG: LptA/OstA family protein [Candidatus Omnitrophota bacterium]
MHFNKLKKIILTAVFIFMAFSGIAFCDEKVLPVEITGDQIDYMEGTMHVKKNVKIKYKDMVVTCDEATYDATGYVANLTGHVKIDREDGTVYGEKVIYNFDTQEATMVNMRMAFPPMYAHANEAKKDGGSKYVLNDGFFTTCDLEKPHYRLTAKKIIAYPNVKIIAKDMIMKIGEVPILYIPYISIPLKDNAFPIQITPGSKGDWGNYVLGRYRYRFNAREKGRIILDWYEKRGLGLGITHNATTKDFGKALVDLYYIDDEMYKTKNRDELFDKYPERASINEKYLQSERYKAQFTHSWNPTENLSIISELNKFSDENFMKDFFYREYEIEPQPLTYNLSTYSFDRSSLSLLTQKKVNYFYSQTEYLPQMEYDFYQQSLGNSGFYLESKTTAGSLSYKSSDGATKYNSDRVYNLSTFSYPKTFGWFYTNPYIGDYATFYSKNVTGTKELWRNAPTAGIDLSTKLYRAFDTDFNLFGKPVDKMRHIFTPTISYEYIHPPNIPVSEVLQFDSLDSLQRSETVTIKLDNKLQARNEARTWDFIYFSPALQYQVNKKDKRGVLDKVGTYLDNIQSTFEAYPVDGFGMRTTTTYDCVVEAFKEGNLDFTFSDTKNKKYAVTLGQRYARQYDYAVDTAEYSSQTTLDYTYQLTNKLQFKNYMRYEFKGGDFLEQQYSLRQDLHCWWADFGVTVDKQREGVTDLTFWLTFTLKAFPDVSLGFDHSYSGSKTSY